MEAALLPSQLAQVSAQVSGKAAAAVGGAAFPGVLVQVPGSVYETGTEGQQSLHTAEHARRGRRLLSSVGTVN